MRTTQSLTLSWQTAKMKALDCSAFWSVLEAAVNKWMFLPLFVHFSTYSCWWFRGGNSGDKWRKTFLAGVIKRDKWVESVKCTQLTEGGFIFTHTCARPAQNIFHDEFNIWDAWQQLLEWRYSSPKTVWKLLSPDLPLLCRRCCSIYVHGQDSICMPTEECN